MSKNSRFLSLEREFKMRVDEDYKDFKIESAYLPNPEINFKPNFVLIAMEPSLKGKDAEALRMKVEKEGFLNFLLSERDFILHYCAWKFLCGEKFNYYVTDISKGAMRVDRANIDRNGRYAKWRPLLEKELRLLGVPKVKVIAVGKKVKATLDCFNIPMQGNVLHYSGQNARWVNERCNEYGREGRDFLEKEEPSERDLKDFLRKLCGSIEYRLEKDLEKRLFNEPLSLSKKKLILHYKVEFEKLS